MVRLGTSEIIITAKISLWTLFQKLKLTDPLRPNYKRISRYVRILKKRSRHKHILLVYVLQIQDMNFFKNIDDCTG